MHAWDGTDLIRPAFCNLILKGFMADTIFEILVAGQKQGNKVTGKGPVCLLYVRWAYLLKFLTFKSCFPTYSGSNSLHRICC